MSKETSPTTVVRSAGRWGGDRCIESSCLCVVMRHSVPQVQKLVYLLGFEAGLLDVGVCEKLSGPQSHCLFVDGIVMAWTGVTS